MSDQQSPTPGPEHKRLEIFVGEWKTEGEILASEAGPASRLVAVDRYEWLPGGFFLLHHVNGRMGDVEVKALEIIGYDPSSQTYTTHSFDNHGNSSAYQASLRDRDWKNTGESERFNGVFSEDGHILTGRWEQSRDGST